MIVKLLASGPPSTMRYAGCPDLIGTIGGLNVIADFKTSNGPYCASSPDRGDRAGYGGWRKFQKCAQQLGAYRYDSTNVLALSVM